VIICFANFVRCKMSIILSHTYTLMAFFVLAELSEKTSWIRKVADNVRNQLCATEEFDEQSLSEVWTPFLDVLVEVSTGRPDALEAAESPPRPKVYDTRHNPLCLHQPRLPPISSRPDLASAA
jgi:hypothetical protein